MTALICAIVFFSTVLGVLMIRLPTAAPPMTTNSLGWFSTSTSPPAIM